MHRNVSNVGVGYDFDELLSTESEIRGIFKTAISSNGVLEGEVFLNKEFTKENMLSALNKKRPVVHISSHFKAQSGDITRSFLLLGDGTAFSLFDMRKEMDIFNGVDLLTLSACNTALDERNSDGREIDGFAELAQRLGAASVLATLWSVNECSTAEIMTRFYKNKVTGRMTKPDALRNAQLALLDGRVKRSESACSNKEVKKAPNPVEPKSVKSFKAFKYNRSKPFEHPYYWASFVIYGNWR